MTYLGRMCIRIEVFRGFNGGFPSFYPGQLIDATPSPLSLDEEADRARYWSRNALNDASRAYQRRRAARLACLADHHRRREAGRIGRRLTIRLSADFAEWCDQQEDR